MRAPKIFVSISLALAVSLAGCSLIASRDGYTFGEGVDAGPADAGERDGGGGLDAATDPPAEAPAVRFPWNGYQTGSVHTGSLPQFQNALRPRFLWDAVPGATRYELELSSACDIPTRDSCSFSGAIQGSTSELSWAPEEALPAATSAPVGRRYVWRMRACNPAGCGPWAPARYLDVGRQPGDVDGDGYADILLGGPNEDRAMDGSYSGRVHAFRGPSLNLTLSMQDTTQRFYGKGTVTVGDVDADGFADWIVGGNPNTTVRFGEPTPFASPFARTLLAPTESPRAVSGAGDLNGDGNSDLVFGMVSRTDDPINAGSVEIYGGGSTSPALTQRLLSPTPTATGYFGDGVVSHADFNGDGYVDLAVGAFREPGGGVGEAGRVYIYAGGPSGVAADPSTSYVSPNSEPSGGFGNTLTAADLDGDGLAELIVSAAGEAVGGLERAGRVYVYMGHRGFAGEVVVITAPTPTALVAFGAGLSAAFRTPAGGRLLAIGAPNESEGGIGGVGHIYVYAIDNPDAPMGVLSAPTPREFLGFGSSIGLVGDVEGEGRSTLVVGSTFADDERGTSWFIRESISGAPGIMEQSSPTPADFGGYGSGGGTHWSI